MIAWPGLWPPTHCYARGPNEWPLQTPLLSGLGLCSDSLDYTTSTILLNQEIPIACHFSSPSSSLSDLPLSFCTITNANLRNTTISPGYEICSLLGCNKFHYFSNLLSLSVAELSISTACSLFATLAQNFFLHKHNFTCKA